MIKKIITVACIIAFFCQAYTQDIHGDRNQKWKENYRESPEKKFQLKHTKLNVDFNFSNSTLNGEEWVTLSPYFYEQSTLILDAKAMLIHEVSLNNITLKYTYDDTFLTIDLPKIYKKGEELTLYIKYTAQPEKVKQKGSAAITDAKGLYFIDPLEEDSEKPTQVWTQGETESSSCWFPTIDKPNQKTTQEIYITVPKKYATLSNGTLISSVEKSRNLRTDYWKMDQSHAPYLFFMGVGEYEIIQDTWKGKKVDYYVEKEYAPYAKQTYGMTPEMMTFFSDFTGIEYPWAKYSQLVGRDYVSGAMENTTAVIHGESVNQKDYQLNDENTWEDVIAHELFHHWFGDYVTCESWSNLTVNESFANYSEYLWREFKDGKMHADSHLKEQLDGYFGDPKNQKKDLVRFHYESKEDMFDGVSYNKGGAILNMLRNYLGDKAFKAGIHTYLKENKYSTGEAHQLRLAFEKVSGKDLNWFFNQWYFGAGHPVLTINYKKNKNSVVVNVKQLQDKLFRLPLKVAVYTDKGVTYKNIIVKDKNQDFTFDIKGDLKLVNVDADRILVGKITDNKTVEEYLFQLENTPNFMDHYRALEALKVHNAEKKVQEALLSYIQNSKNYHQLVIKAMKTVDFTDKKKKKELVKVCESLVSKTKNNLIKGKALSFLAKAKKINYFPLFEKGLQQKSYAVSSASLSGLYDLNPTKGLEKAKELLTIAEGDLAHSIFKILVKENDQTQLSHIAENSFMFVYSEGEDRALMEKGFNMVSESSDIKAMQTLVTNIVDTGKKYKKYGADKVMKQVLNQVLYKKKKQDKSDAFQKQIEILNTGISEL